MKVVAFAGGVGGAKLAHGLAQVVDDLTVIVNTGDDFEHFGLQICPDIDTVCYTLAGLANPVTGWGRIGESWNTIAAVGKLGGPTWFNLGDQDLATHLERTRRLRQGEPLSAITRTFCHAWGIRATVLPMSDDPVATWVLSVDEGALPFQEYFVHRQCQPVVTGFRFEGVESARPAPGVMEAIEDADVVIFCPSNPWVSIGPILAVAPIQACLSRKKVIAVSPIVGGKAIKGPAAKMYQELGIEPSAQAVAAQYGGLLAGFVLDQVDQQHSVAIESTGIPTHVTDTVMQSVEDRRRLAEEMLSFSARL